MDTYVNINSLLKQLQDYKFTLSELNNNCIGYIRNKDFILLKATEQNSKKEFLMNLYKKKYYLNNSDYDDKFVSPFIRIKDIYYIDTNMYIKYDLLKDWCILKYININDCLELINNVNQSPSLSIDEIDFLLEKANYSGKTEIVLKLEQMKKNKLNKNVEIHNVDKQEIIKNIQNLENDDGMFEL